MEQRKISYLQGRLVWLAAFALVLASLSFAQDAPLAPVGEYGVVPWTGGTVDDALNQSASGATVPLSAYPFVATKDGSARVAVLVGGNPVFAGPFPVTIDAVVIPVKMAIGAKVFDPTAKNACDGSVSALTRFKQSPLVVSTKLVFNGVNVGTHQYINGFMRAEFWGLIKGLSSYSNTIKWSYAPPIALLPGPFGITNGTGCSEIGVVTNSWLDLQLQLMIPLLQASGVLSPTKLAVFLLNNVVQSTATPPNLTNCCILGYHGAVGSPVQTYSPMNYDTTGRVPPDISIPAHELGEWANDPLGNNATPAWGHIGQVSGCQGNFEVGDPLTGTNMPAITLSGHAYHAQELAFFSWFYNAHTTPSLGTGGKFSGHGTFSGPSKVCPPGGTF